MQVRCNAVQPSHGHYSNDARFQSSLVSSRGVPSLSVVDGRRHGILPSVAVSCLR